MKHEKMDITDLKRRLKDLDRPLVVGSRKELITHDSKVICLKIRLLSYNNTDVLSKMLFFLISWF